MKKKTVLAALALAVMLAVGGGALVGCGGNSHEHTYSTDWAHDATNHWHVATCDDLKEGDKDYKSGIAAHVWGDDDICDICKYDKNANAGTPGGTAEEYTITLNVGSGTIAGETSLKTTDGKVTLSAPTAPADHWFKGWYTAETDGEQVTADTVFTADANVYARYVAEVTITFEAGDKGTLAEGVANTCKTVNGKIPTDKVPTTVTVADNTFKFYDWYNGNNSLDVENDVFETATTITAKVAQTDGLWNKDGTERIAALTVNKGNTEDNCVEYWFGQGVKTLIEKDTVITVYIDGNKKENFWLNGSCVAINDPNGYGGMNTTEVTVTETANFEVYIKVYGNGGSNYKFQGVSTSALEVVSTVPNGCVPITVKFANGDVTFYLIDATGKAVDAEKAATIQIHAFPGNLFGEWASNPYLNEIEKLTLNVDLPDGTTFMFHWATAENGKTQTGDILKITIGKSFVVNLGDNSVKEYVASTEAE